MEQKTHGGYRPGAGRKTKYEKTTVLRIPEKYKDTIKALIEHLDATEHICEGYEAETSSPIYMRSLKDKKQHINFTTTPIKG